MNGAVAHRSKPCSAANNNIWRLLLFTNHTVLNERGGWFSSAKTRMKCKRSSIYTTVQKSPPDSLLCHSITSTDCIMFSYLTQNLCLTYLYRDEASQLQMSLHHGETSKKVSALWGEVGKLPSQESKSKKKKQQNWENQWKACNRRGAQARMMPHPDLTSEPLQVKTGLLLFWEDEGL